jgi:hypothetical protein
VTQALEIAEARQNRSFLFRPQDPIWAPSSALERARKALSDYDWRLGLWWSPMRALGRDEERPGRWRVVEWMPRHGNHHTVFYLEGPEGQFRDFEPVDAILARLRKAASVDTKTAAAQADQAAQDRELQRRTELAEANREFQEDHAARYHGVRQTFGPGYIRRRSVKRSDIADTNHQRFVREHLKKWDGSPK